MVLHGVLMAALLTSGEAPGLVKRIPAADGRCYTNDATFQVPYRLESAPPPTSLMKPALYYSNDAGKHWELGAVDVDGVSPVTFHAPGEGEYWLRMGLRRLGETAKPDLGRQREGGLVVVVDTQPPSVRLVPRLVQDADRGPTIALKVAIDDEPLEPPDIAVEVELPAIEGEPGGRHLWIEHAEVGREYLWLLDPRQAPPTAFHAKAVDQAGNVGSDTLQMSLLIRQAGFERLARPEIVQPRVVRPIAPAPDGSGMLAAAVEYTVEGPPLAGDECVEVWYTEDRGQTWQAGARHVERQEPLVFTAPRPGLYGLRLVLRRGTGVVGEPPASGTQPQMYVVMERAAEDAQIVAVKAPGATGSEPAAAANLPTDLSAQPMGTRCGIVSPFSVAATPPVPADPPPRIVDRATQARTAYQTGNYLRLQGRWEEAARHFREAIRHDPKCFEAHNDLAGCLYRLGRFEEASDCFYRAIDLQPRQSDTRFSLARTLMHLGRLDDALSQLDEVVHLNPTDGEAWLYRGDLLFSRRGDVTAARTCWQKALDNAPGSAPWADLARRQLARHPP